MDAMTAPAILAEQLAARGLSVKNQGEHALCVTNPLHALLGETVTEHGGCYLTGYGYELGVHGDEPATADRLVFRLGLPHAARALEGVR
ncbi:hypothetical protein ACLMNJ_06130 [Streptomyces seoulensis]